MLTKMTTIAYACPRILRNHPGKYLADDCLPPSPTSHRALWLGRLDLQAVTDAVYCSDISIVRPGGRLSCRVTRMRFNSHAISPSVLRLQAHDKVLIRPFEPNTRSISVRGSARMASVADGNGPELRVRKMFPNSFVPLLPTLSSTAGL